MGDEIKRPKYLKLADTWVPPSHPFRKRGELELPRGAQPHLHSEDETLCEEIIELSAEAPHEIKIHLFACFNWLLRVTNIKFASELTF